MGPLRTARTGYLEWERGDPRKRTVSPSLREVEEAGSSPREMQPRSSPEECPFLPWEVCRAVL